MRTFYTAHDIEDLVASGGTELEIDESTVVTDEAREKARKHGLKVTMISKKATNAQQADVEQGEEPDSDGTAGEGDPALISRIKSTVIARMGNDSDGDILDKIIPIVLSRFVD